MRSSGWPVVGTRSVVIALVDPVPQPRDSRGRRASTIRAVTGRRVGPTLISTSGCFLRLKYQPGAFGAPAVGCDDQIVRCRRSRSSGTRCEPCRSSRRRCAAAGTLGSRGADARSGRWFADRSCRAPSAAERRMISLPRGSAHDVSVPVPPARPAGSGRLPPGRGRGAPPDPWRTTACRRSGAARRAGGCERRSGRRPCRR